MCVPTPGKKKITKVFLVLKVNEVMRIAAPAVSLYFLRIHVETFKRIILRMTLIL